MKNRSATGIPSSIAFLTMIMALILIAACSSDRLPPGDPANGGLFLPEGFEALVVIDSIEGMARQLAVRDNGDIFVKLRRHRNAPGNAALRDTDGDGKADIVEKFGDYLGTQGYGTAMRIHNGYLYYSSELVVYRQKLEGQSLIPTTPMEEVFVDDHEHGTHEHIAKPIAFDKEGHIYIAFGAPSNACQQPKRTPGQPGLDPCPHLEDHAGVWQFDAGKTGLRQKDGVKFATGLRSIVAMEWNPIDENLYAVVHGRDDLLRLFPAIFTPWESAVYPSEEFVKLTKGSDFGWPYCFYDQINEVKVLAPEYGGDGKIIGRCEGYDKPIMGFPGHWAPNDLLYYQGDQFPERYKHGAFIAFHGSTNRAPYPQSGYFVAFIPFTNGLPDNRWEVFADGFAQVDPIVNVSDAVYRPMGLAEGPDGSLYLGDTEKGKIWRVMFKGDKETFGVQQLQKMEDRKSLSHLRNPDPIEDNLLKDVTDLSAETYRIYCGTCHQMNGKGAPGRFPPLAETDWVTGDKERLIHIVLHGMEGAINVNGELYNAAMPQHGYLTDEKIAEVLTYIRSNFGNAASAVTPQEVARVRRKTQKPM